VEKDTPFNGQFGNPIAGLGVPEKIRAAEHDLTPASKSPGTLQLQRPLGDLYGLATMVGIRTEISEMNDAHAPCMAYARQGQIFQGVEPFRVIVRINQNNYPKSLRNTCLYKVRAIAHLCALCNRALFGVAQLQLYRTRHGLLPVEGLGMNKSGDGSGLWLERQNGLYQYSAG
jgi:hypothetical protein